MKRLFSLALSAVVLSGCTALRLPIGKQAAATPTPETIKTKEVDIQLQPPSIGGPTAPVSTVVGKAQIHPILLTLSITNNTQSPLSHVVLATAKGQLFFYDSKDIRYNKTASTGTDYLYDIDDISPGQTLSGNLSAYSFTLGEYPVKFSLSSAEGKTGSSNSFPLTFTAQ